MFLPFSFLILVGPFISRIDCLRSLRSKLIDQEGLVAPHHYLAVFFRGRLDQL